MFFVRYCCCCCEMVLGHVLLVALLLSWGPTWGRSAATLRSSPTVGDRVVNGELAKISQHPWMVYVEIHTDKKKKGKSFICGGAILSPNLIVTAKHCLRDEKTKKKYAKGYGLLKIGYKNIAHKRGLHDEFVIDRDCALHPNADIDVALIFVQKSIQMKKDRIQPIPLPKDTFQNPSPGDPAIISGWGKTCGTPKKRQKRCNPGSDSQNHMPDNLLDGRVTISGTPCATEYSGREDKHPYVLCAVSKGGSDQCQGDSGGPLECFTHGKSGNKYLCGLSSFGPPSPNCGDRENPSAYVKVSHPEVLNFIKDNINNNRTGDKTPDKKKKKPKKKGLCDRPESSIVLSFWSLVVLMHVLHTR